MRSYEKSKAAFKEAQKLMPGGVNSPVRAFKSVDMDPIFMQRGKGSKIFEMRSRDISPVTRLPSQKSSSRSA